MSEFKDRLITAMNMRQISSAELSRISGVNEGAISQYRKGKYKASQENLERLAKALLVDIPWLMGADVPMSRSTSDVTNIIPMPKMNQIPLIGEIACGKPILAVEDATELVDVPDHIHADFALRCKGDSMINARIFDGDVVYIRSQPIVETGEIAAVLIGEEATLKRVHLFDDHISLEPENPMYKPLVYWGNDMNSVQILGKAVAFTSLIL